MRVVLRQMGKAAGVIIPRSFLRTIGATQAVEMSIEDRRIVIAAEKRAARAGWAEASRSLVVDDDEGLVWPEFANEDDAALVW